MSSNHRAKHDQPEPTPSDHPDVWALVLDDMAERDAVGRARYGTPLRGHNGRDALRDAYSESLDLSVYLRQAIYERDGQSQAIRDAVQAEQDRCCKLIYGYCSSDNTAERTVAAIRARPMTE